MSLRLPELPTDPAAPFPPGERALRQPDGLLAIGGDLSATRLLNAYRAGIFPWYSEGQPILWWCPDPRTVFRTESFRLSSRFRRTLRQLPWVVRADTAFETVIDVCARIPRQGQDGTWILPAMVQAYTRLHHAGVAHSVETWIDGELAGGLYCINLGGMVYGESMFSRQSDASKIALASLVAFCRAKDLPLIDCQQNTPHLASLGGQLMPRATFCRHVGEAMSRPAPRWEFQPIYWQNVIPEHRRPA